MPNYALIAAMIEKQVRSYMEQGACQEEIHQMVFSEVECAERRYPGFLAWTETESEDLLTWYHILF